MYVKYPDGTIATGLASSQLPDIQEPYTDAGVVRPIRTQATACMVHIVNGEYVGSGFVGTHPDIAAAFPDHDFVFTAAHVIMSEGNQLSTGLVLHLMTPANAIRRDVDANEDVLIYSVRADIAVLKIPKQQGREALPICPRDNTAPTVGDLAFVIGWTFGFDEQNFTQVRIKDIGFENNLNAPIDSLLCDNVTMAGGNSGGPWLDVHGRVIAISSWGYTGATDFSNSFDLFGVSWRSIDQLCGIAALSEGTVQQFAGMRLAGEYNMMVPVDPYMAATRFTFLDELKGYALGVVDTDTGDITYDTTKVLIDVNGSGELGPLNSQKRAGFRIYYAFPSDNTLPCTFLHADGSTSFGTLDVEEHTEESMFSPLNK